MSATAPPGRARSLGSAGLLGRVADVRPGEGGALLLAFAYCFALLCGMYLLRPLREETGIRGGVDRLDRASSRPSSSCSRRYLWLATAVYLARKHALLET